MSAPLPDDTMTLDGKLVRLTERELISRWAQIGPKGKWVEIRYVVSRAVPA